MAKPPIALFLAQISDSDIHEIIMVCLGLLGLFVITLIVATYLKRWARQADALPPRGFALEELRRLHREGKMSDEEFKKTSALVAKAQKAQHLPGSTDKSKPPL